MSTDEKVVLMIVEDDPFVGGWLGNHCEHLFDDIRNFEVAETAIANARSMGQGARRVWIVDLNLAEGSKGGELCLEVKNTYPNDRVIILSRTKDLAIIWMTVKYAKADAFITKGYGDKYAFEIQRAVDAAIDGAPYENDLMRSLPEENPSVIAKLTDRQKEMLELADKGFSNAEIANFWQVNRASIARTREAIEKKTRLGWEDLLAKRQSEGWYMVRE
jgi:DNA-binding NarL/FixJ family response regulator